MPFKNPPPLYSVWQGMRRRCRNPNFKQWADYGGRGISICPEWDDYSVFERDMSPRPVGASIKRIDPDGDYGPGNCRWASQKEQMRNQRRTIYVEVDGVRHKAIDLAERSGLKVDTIVQRASIGMTFDALMKKTRYANKHGWRAAVAARVANQRVRAQCKHGHDYTPENTGISKQGHRFCRSCHRLKVARQNERKRASS